PIGRAQWLFACLFFSTEPSEPGIITMLRFVFSTFATAKKWVDAVTGLESKSARRKRKRQDKKLKPTLETLEVRLNPDGRIIASSFFDGGLYQFNANTGALV